MPCSRNHRTWAYGIEVGPPMVQPPPCIILSQRKAVAVMSCWCEAQSESPARQPSLHNHGQVQIPNKRSSIWMDLSHNAQYHRGGLAGVWDRVHLKVTPAALHVVEGLEAHPQIRREGGAVENEVWHGVYMSEDVNVNFRDVGEQQVGARDELDGLVDAIVSGKRCAG